MLCASTGNILTGLIDAQWGSKLKQKPRIWKTQQFAIGYETLDHFFSGKEPPVKYRFGAYQVWVSEDEIENLYGYMAACIFESYAKDALQKHVFYAFLFQTNRDAFFKMSIDTLTDMRSYLHHKGHGKEFLTWLEENEALSYLSRAEFYPVRIRCSQSEFVLIDCPKKDVARMLTRQESN